MKRTRADRQAEYKQSVERTFEQNGLKGHRRKGLQSKIVALMDRAYEEGQLSMRQPSKLKPAPNFLEQAAKV